MGQAGYEKGVREANDQTEHRVKKIGTKIDE